MNRTRIAVLAVSLWITACAAQQPKAEGNSSPAPQASAQAELPPPDSEDAEAIYAYAIQMEERGKDTEAIAYYSQATQVNPEHIKAHIALAQLYTKLARVDEAKVAFENILRLDREHPFVAKYKEARLKYYSALNIAQNDEFDKALKLLSEAPRSTPLDAEIAAKEKEWKDRLRGGSDLRKSQEIIEQASLLAYQGKYQQAIELIRTAPDASSNSMIGDKIQQWEKAVQNNASPEVTVTPPPIANQRKYHYIQGNDVNLRQSPYLYAESLGTLSNGASVELLLDKGYEADGYQWSKVKTADGKIGWVAANLLRGSLATTHTVIQATPVPLRPAASAPPIRTDNRQDGVRSDIASYGTRYIVGDTVNVRRSPSLQGTLVARAIQGSPVILLSKQSVSADGYQWSKVKLNDGQQGWVANSFLRLPSAKPPLNTRPLPPVATATAKPVSQSNSSQAIRYITGRDVNVRVQPGVAATLLRQLSAPSVVGLTTAALVKKDGFTWQQIVLPGGQKGWVSVGFLSAKRPSSSSAVASAPIKTARRVIRGDGVNIRTTASTTGTIVTQLNEGSPVTLLSLTPVKQGGHNWYKVRLTDGRLGWVVGSFLGTGN